jgi:hypothetical protein
MSVPEFSNSRFAQKFCDEQRMGSNFSRSRIICSSEIRLRLLNDTKMLFAISNAENFGYDCIVGFQLGKNATTIRSILGGIAWKTPRDRYRGIENEFGHQYRRPSCKSLRVIGSPRLSRCFSPNSIMRRTASRREASRPAWLCRDSRAMAASMNSSTDFTVPLLMACSRILSCSALSVIVMRDALCYCLKFRYSKAGLAVCHFQSMGVESRRNSQKGV